jgi:DNA-binding transcriptional ArsR family regulator
MLMNALRWIREAGIEIIEIHDVGSERATNEEVNVDCILEVVGGRASTKFAVEQRGRAPYPNELGSLETHRAALRMLGLPLLIVPFVSEPLGATLVDAGWSWADSQGNFDLRGPGLLLRQRQNNKAPESTRKTLPQGSGSLAIIRALVRFGEGEDEEGAATSLAAQARVSQPRASQVLRQLQNLGLVERTGRGRWRPYRDVLLDRFLAEYAGPRGSEQLLYSLDPPTRVAVAAAQALGVHHSFVVSADVGPDLVTAWRRPSVLVLYTNHGIDVRPLGLVGAQSRDDANVIVRSPEDQSVFPVPAFVAEAGGIDIPLADPSQMIWDLRELGGADRLEAAGQLREWVLQRP